MQLVEGCLPLSIPMSYTNNSNLDTCFDTLMKFIDLLLFLKLKLLRGTNIYLHVRMFDVMGSAKGIAL